jgi:DNA polymerase elongation subunit (family B)
MIEASNANLVPIFGDTDSAYFADAQGNPIDNKVIDCFYFDFFNEWFKKFNLIIKHSQKHPTSGEFKEVNHFTSFQFEKSLIKCIDIRKKKYFYTTYDKKEDKIKMKIKGASALKSDTLKTAADISIELARSILFDTFNMEEWKSKILELKRRVYNFELNDEEIFKFVSLTKSLDSYGGGVIDGATGKPKVKKDGTIQHSGVPAHVKVAKAMKDKGILVDVGDKVGYVIVSHKPNITAISIQEYKENKRYDAVYYWNSIESSILEVLEAVCPNDVYDFFSECWSFSQKVQERMKRELTERFLNYDTIKIFGDMKNKNPMKMRGVV